MQVKKKKKNREAITLLSSVIKVERTKRGSNSNQKRVFLVECLNKEVKKFKKIQYC